MSNNQIIPSCCFRCEGCLPSPSQPGQRNEDFSTGSHALNDAQWLCLFKLELQGRECYKWPLTKTGGRLANVVAPLAHFVREWPRVLGRFFSQNLHDTECHRALLISGFHVQENNRAYVGFDGKQDFLKAGVSLLSSTNQNTSGGMRWSLRPNLKKGFFLK